MTVRGGRCARLLQGSTITPSLRKHWRPPSLNLSCKALTFRASSSVLRPKTHSRTHMHDHDQPKPTPPPTHSTDIKTTLDTLAQQLDDGALSTTDGIDQLLQRHADRSPELLAGKPQRTPYLPHHALQQTPPQHWAPRVPLPCFTAYWSSSSTTHRHTPPQQPRCARCAPACPLPTTASSLSAGTACRCCCVRGAAATICNSRRRCALQLLWLPPRVSSQRIRSWSAGWPKA